MNTFLIAVISIALAVAGQFALKAGMSSAEIKGALSQPFALRTLLFALANKYVIGGLVLYGLGAVVWLAVLYRWDVSKAYPLIGLGFGATVIIGLLAGEHVTPLRGFGVALICVGVILVGQN